MDIKFTSNSKQIIANLSGLKQSTLEEIKDLLVTEAQKRVPIDTGELHDSISGNVDGDSVSVGAAAEHAAAVEKGTSKQIAQPYLTPAAEENLNKIAAIAQKGLKSL